MVFGHVVPNPRGNLSIQQSLDLANIYLGHAGKALDPDIALVLCHDTEVSLFQAKRAAKQGDDHVVRHGITAAYIGLGRVLELWGHCNEAQGIYKKAEKLAGKVQELAQPAQPLDTKNVAPSVKCTVDSTTNTLSVKDQPPSLRENNTTNTVAMPAHIFAENVCPSTVVAKLPEKDDRLDSTAQLACCLGLLKDPHELDDIPEPATRNWLQIFKNDEDEHERLKMLAADVVRTFKEREIMDAKAVAEVVSLAPVIGRDIFRDLLMSFYDVIDHSGLLDVHHFQGLAQVIQGADTGHLEADDVVKVLELLITRFQETHQQPPQHIYQLALAVSCVLDAMADTKVEGLDLESLLKPMLPYLDALNKNSEPYLVYQAAYAYQALLCVLDNESLWQATTRSTEKLIQRESGLDLNRFIGGLKVIQQATAFEADQGVFTIFDGMNSIPTITQGLLDGVKDGLDFKHKCAWYSALRGADTLIRDGDFAVFKHLVCEAPCRMDPAFQWGICQRLGEVASDPLWDAHTRQSAAAFLGELYRNEDDWGLQASVKEWILIILVRLLSLPESDHQCISMLLRELETGMDAKEKASLQACRKKDHISYPLRLRLPPLASPSLLDRVQNKPDVEDTLRQLRKQRLKERGCAIYIQPQSEGGLKTSDGQGIPLVERVQEFLNNERKVFLLLGDSGSGKSTFNLHLERSLWNNYKKTTGKIPLHINLPAIEKPEQDMITKQLRRFEFTEQEIRELKIHRQFILICDGYDESQQTHNLYMSNRLNQPGEWNAQMVISYRSENLGLDYQDRFQPEDHNSRSDPEKFQQATITPFTPDQVQDYIKQYVSIYQPLWDARQYQQALDLVPGLKELVRNPFLMTLSMEVLPKMVNLREQLSVKQVTRVALYDQFIENWLERSKKRLGEKKLSPQAEAAFQNLVDEGFTQNGLDFLKKLAVAIYKEQGGQPIVRYSRFKDEGTRKAAFFGREEEKQLLREAIPLTRSGNQHQFIHRSLLEYGVALAIYDPHDWKESSVPVLISGRRGSTSSAYSFNIDGASEEEVTLIEKVPDVNSPLAWRYFIHDPSVLQFLCERVHQEPVFKEQLLDYIEHSKTDEKWRIAAANAITILVRSGVSFHGADLRNVRIPGADLSYGIFDSASLQDADLRKVTLRGAWLRLVDLSRAQMSGVQFGELPFIHEDSKVLSCAYSPDGKLLATSLESGDINVYSTSSWERTRTLMGHNDNIRKLAFSPSGERLVSGSRDSTVRLWDVESGSCIYTLTGHDGEVTCVAYSPRGDTIVSSGDEGAVRVWDVETGDLRIIFIGHAMYALSVAFSPDGGQIASGGGDHTIRLWDIGTETCLRTLSDHEGIAWGLVYSPQGDILASSNGDDVTRLWDVKTGTCCRILSGSNYTVDYSPQGDRVASAGRDRIVRLWDSETGTCRQVLTGHSDNIWCIAFPPHGDIIASASRDKTVRLWEIGSGGSRQIQVGHSEGVTRIKYSPQGDQVASSSKDGTIRVWDVETGVCHQVLEGHTDRIRSFAYSPRGDMIVSGSDDNTLKLWDVKSGTCRQPFSDHDDWIEAVAYSPRGDQVASGDGDGMVKLWDMDTGACTHILIGHTCRVRSIVYSPKGNQVASNSYDDTARLWDTKSGDCLYTISEHYGETNSIAYSPLGDVFASSSEDRSLKLFDVEKWDCRHILVGHTDSVQFVAFSFSGDQVASGGFGGSLKLWNVDTGCCLYDLTGHTNAITSMAFSRNGGEMVSGSRDNTVRLWDVVSGHCRAVIQDLNHEIVSTEWGPLSDADCFVVGCEDGSVRRWRVTGEGDERRVQLCWCSAIQSLCLTEALIQDVRGLSRLNMQLLKQRGAVGEPIFRRSTEHRWYPDS